MTGSYRGGQAWWERILAEVRGCNLFVFVLDPRSLESVACHSEFHYAAQVGKPILPVLIADGVALNLLPPELSRIQFVDYRKRDHEAGMALARAVFTIPPDPPLPEPLPPAPEVPSSYLGGLTSRLEGAEPLSYEAQSAMLLDLRRSLRDPEFAADARSLLKKLRRRRDLFAAIAEEIDGIGGLEAGAGAGAGPVRAEPVIEPVPEVRQGGQAGASRFAQIALLVIAAGTAGAVWWDRSRPERQREPQAEQPKRESPLNLVAPEGRSAPPVTYGFRALANGEEVWLTNEERRLIDFIEDPTKPVDKTTWFDCDGIRFVTGKAELEPSSQGQIDRLAAILKAYPKVKLKVAGHSDSMGDAQANLTLTGQRALAVMKAIVGPGRLEGGTGRLTYRIDPARLTWEGYGSAHPMADNSTEEGRARNRRIALRVTEK